MLVSVCAMGLFLGSSYLGESSAQASDGQAGRLIEMRESISGTLMDNGREIAYGLEHVLDELGDLIP
jgi:hypothetical protein